MLFQNRFEKAVKFLNALISNAVSLQILKCIKVIQKEDSITYEATDLDNFLKITLPLWTEVTGEYLVDVKTMMALKNKIATKVEKNKVYFGNVTLPNNDTKEFPSLETGFLKNPVFELSNVSKREIVTIGKRLSNYVLKGSYTREYLKSICLQNDFFYATDGHCVLRYKHEFNLKKGSQFIIPPSFFKFLANDFVLDDLVDIAVYKAGKDQQYIIARGMSFELVSKLIDGEYPDVENILPKKYAFSFIVDTQDFLKITNEAVDYANPKGNYITQIITNSSKSKFKVTVENKDSGAIFEDDISVKALNKKKWDGTHVNVKMLASILKDCIGSTVELKFTESLIAPVGIQPKDDREFFIIMPLRSIDVDDEGEKEKDEAVNDNVKSGKGKSKK